jgi:hypothetical protein
MVPLPKARQEKRCRRQKGAGLKRIFTPSFMMRLEHASACRISWPSVACDQPRQRALPSMRMTQTRSAFWPFSQVVQRYPWLCHAYCPMANYSYLLLETEVGWTSCR